jgi:adenylate cyclase
VLGGAYSAEEIEERTDLSTGMMVRIRRLHGLPEPGPGDKVFSEEDVEAARSTKMFLDAGFSEERFIEITRVLGEGMGRLATTIMAAFAQTFLQKGDNEENVALRFAELAEQLTPATGPILVAAFNAHLREAVSRAMLGRAELESGDAVGSQELTVCFADLVGFTRLGTRRRLRPGACPGRRLLRQLGQPGQPRDRRRSPGKRALQPGGARRRC